MSDSTKSQLNLARLIYDAYPDADLLDIDPEKHLVDIKTLCDHCELEGAGDMLFDFIVFEVYGTTIGLESDDVIEDVEMAIDSAVDALIAIQNALVKAKLATQTGE